MKLQIALLMTALGASTAGAVQAAEYEEYGRVTRVEPRVEQVRQPREECRTEYVQVAPQPVQRERSAGGAILGAVAGGILGNQVGGGSGKAAATALGAVAGAVAGDRISNGGPNSQPEYDSRYPQEQAVRRCRTVDAYESRTIGYDVTYNYGGRSYTSMMPRDPGDRVRLRVSVEPDPRQ
ncbi:glycine zipper 2TM domain-containing protein [Massilia sp. CF038]|uniref:glycine zipper 2TM domain-containing protein n=1 Tax=Massilia sp. CF038 TaxID=1881045 RepID=UPI00091BCE18|nr:glycine zipper 2TM domain-containing protein [Massilia sp. CF038]SHG42276.1 Uncharacterized conserved protein YcfJ, contains glycine zipper 2TM domain [Massilia sp. CF038]